MTADIKGWLGTLALAAGTIVAVTALVLLRTMDTNSKIAEAIKGGANPLDVSCAYKSDTTYCMMRASKKE